MDQAACTHGETTSEGLASDVAAARMVGQEGNSWGGSTAVTRNEPLSR